MKVLSRLLCFIFIALTMLGIPGGAAQAASPAIAEVCSILNGEIKYNSLETCNIALPSYVNNRTGDAVIEKFKSDVEARDRIEGLRKAQDYFTITGYGESAVEQSATKYRTYNIAFSRGPFTARFYASPGNEGAIQAIAREFDQKLEVLITGQVSAPAPGEFAVSLSCGYDYPDVGLVYCVATTANKKPEAEIEFEWHFDGTVQAAKGNEMSRTGVTAGYHIVEVVAIDKNNNLRTKPSSNSFTKSTGAPPGDAAQPQVMVEVRKNSRDNKTTNQMLKPEENIPINLSQDEQVMLALFLWCEEYNARKEVLIAFIKSNGQLFFPDSPAYPLFSAYIRFGLGKDLGRNEFNQIVELCKQIDVSKTPKESAPRLSFSASSAPEESLNLKIKLLQGPLRIEVVHDIVSLEIETGTATVRSSGTGDFGVGYDPASGDSIAVSYQGTMNVIPKNPTLQTFILQTGQMAHVTQNNVSPIDTPEPAIVDRMTLQAGKRRVAAGDIVYLPIWFIKGTDVANMDFTVSYDASVVMPESKLVKGNLLDNALFESNTGENGLIRAAFAQKNGVSGTGTATQIPFRAIGQPGDQTALHLEVTSINDPTGTLLAIDRMDGSIQILRPGEESQGDCDGDTKLTTVDSLCALQMSVKLITERLSLDMNADARVTSRDSVLILQRRLVDIIR